jgi:hypothetical protein
MARPTNEECPPSDVRRPRFSQKQTLAVATSAHTILKSGSMPSKILYQRINQTFARNSCL